MQTQQREKFREGERERCRDREGKDRKKGTLCIYRAEVLPTYKPQERCCKKG